MNWKTELKWGTGFLLASLVLVGLTTEFRFGVIEVQLHDTYFVFEAYDVIYKLILILYMIKNLYLMVDLMTLKYRLVAFLVAIINPIVGLLLLAFTVTIGMSSAASPSGHGRSPIFTGLLLSVLMLQAFMEIKMLRRLKVMLDE